MRKTLKRYRDRTPDERRAVTRAGLLIAALQTALKVLPFQRVMEGVYRVAGPSPSAGASPGGLMMIGMVCQSVEFIGNSSTISHTCCDSGR